MELLTIAEACTVLGIRTSALYKFLKKENIDLILVNGKNYVERRIIDQIKTKYNP